MRAIAHRVDEPIRHRRARVDDARAGRDRRELADDELEHVRGRQDREQRFLARRLAQRISARRFARRFSCDSSTARGRAVLPEVKTSTAVSDARRARQSCSPRRSGAQGPNRLTARAA